MSAEESGDEYVVEEIRDHTFKDGETYYLIKWQDYSSDSNTWEPLENLNCPELLKKYNDKIKEKRKSELIKRRSTNEPRRSRSASSRTSDTSSSKRKATHESTPNLFDTEDCEMRTSRYRERNDEMVHEEFLNDPFDGKEELFNLGEDTDSDEYETDEEEESDFSACFIYPEFVNPGKIISNVSINNKPFYMIQFDDEKVYYIAPEIADQKCEELVTKFCQRKLIERVTEYRKY